MSFRRVGIAAMAAAMVTMGVSAADPSTPGGTSPEARLKEMGLTLPPPATPVANYVEAVRTGNLLFLAGHGPCGKLDESVTGKVGADRTVEQGYDAAKKTALCLISTLKAELGDLSRFESPRRLMGYLGLTPSEDSSGKRRRQGGITKAGNSSARRAFIEAAWAYAHPARVSWVIARRHTGLSRRITDLAWKAQLRLCARFRRLAARRLPRNKVVVAIARELSGFVWAIVREVKPAA